MKFLKYKLENSEYKMSLFGSILGLDRSFLDKISGDSKVQKYLYSESLYKERMKQQYKNVYN